MNLKSSIPLQWATPYNPTMFFFDNFFGHDKERPRTIKWHFIPQKVSDDAEKNRQEISDQILSQHHYVLTEDPRFQTFGIWNWKWNSQFVMKLEMKSHHQTSCQKNSRNFNGNRNFVTFFDMKTNFTHESGGWKYGMWSKIWFHHHSDWTFFEELSASLLCCCNK